MSLHDNNAIMTDNDNDELFIGWVTDMFIDDVGANQLPPFRSDSQFQPQSQPQLQLHLDPEPLWTEEENKTFKTLVADSFAEVMENRWEAVGPRLPKKIPEQLMERLNKLLKDNNNNLVSSNPIINGTTPTYFTDHQRHSLDQFQAKPWEATMNGNQNYYYPIPPLNGNNNAAFQENNLVSTLIINGTTPSCYFTYHQHQSLGQSQTNPWNATMNINENYYTIPPLNMNNTALQHNHVSMPMMNGATPPYLTHHQSLDQFQTNSWAEVTRNLSQNHYIAPIPNVNNNTALQHNLVTMSIMNNGAIPPYLTHHQYQRMEEEVVAAPAVENVLAMEEQNQPKNQVMAADDNNNNNRKKVDHWTKVEHA
ncbi:hypothetical protein PIB30_093789, partial [Stylosanthes scabra]|nr:hypothetical protein [Stylosanthes scabra]